MPFAGQTGDWRRTGRVPPRLRPDLRRRHRGQPPCGDRARATVACMGRIRVGPARVPSREITGGGGRAPAGARLRRVRDRLRVRLLDGLPVGGAARRGGAGARRRPVRPRAALRLGRPPRDERQEVVVRGRRARPERRDRDGVRRRGRGVPSRVPARAQPRGRDRRGRRTARAGARAARGEGPRRAVRDRGDGARAGSRLARGLRRDQPACRLGATGDRLRAHARHERRGVPRG